MKSSRKGPEKLVRAAFWAAPAVLVAAAVLYATIGGGGSETVYRDLNASVWFDGRRFTVINNDDFMWHNVRIDVNGALIQTGYEITPGTLSPGHEYFFSADRFTDKNGKRFDPTHEDARTVRIACDIDEHEKGMYARRMK